MTTTSVNSSITKANGHVESNNMSTSDEKPHTRKSWRPQTATINWRFWKKEKDYFDGRRHMSEGRRYRRPDRTELSRAFYKGKEFIEDPTEYHHRDIYGRETMEKKTTLMYISPKESVPRPLMVQATREVMQFQPQGDWRRVPLKGKVPPVLKLSTWALAPRNFLLKWIRTILSVIPILILLSLPLEKAWEPTDFGQSYSDFPSICWDYPKHARSRLDSAPGTPQSKLGPVEKSAAPTIQARLLRPRILMVFRDEQWVIDPAPAKHIKYAFISYTNIHFHTRDADPEIARAGMEKVEKLAQARTLGAGLQAYWIDTHCCAPVEEKELHTLDVHRMCDLIRGADRVLVLLPKVTDQNRKIWGARMWTIPEALLCRRQEITFTSPEKIQELSKMDMTDSVWDDGEYDEHEHQSTRLLAEHFCNVLTLGRLELFTVALDALASRSQAGEFSKGDIAYALMGLLHYRIPLDHTDNLFQALARLSLANDSDRLIERMVCMSPPARGPGHNADDKTFLELTEKDEYGSHLWDIEPLCQVAGVGRGDREIILDSCRGVSIRWKSFPQMKYKRSEGLRKLLAEIVLRSGAAWAAAGLALIIKFAVEYENNQTSLTTTLASDKIAVENLQNNIAEDSGLIALGVIGLIAAFLLTLAAPVAVRRLYGGRVMQSEPWLVGFEGTMPAKKLEKVVFGNFNPKEARLTYAPSATIFSEREPEERIGREPAWIADPVNNPRPFTLPQGHRLYTLVDTGDLSITIFSAVRPPSVALIAGREGGMLRAVLCHYERSNNCLYKEAVIRMDSMTLNGADNLSWIKVSLSNGYD